jgi:hypothetical protein
VTPAAIAWAGFAGSWLLVAGPVYQAAIDFQAEDVERDAIQKATDATAKPPPFSRWWWLIPPVGYALQLRRSRIYRHSVMDVLTSAQMEQLVRFGNKATGWILISVGALLVALTETWTLRDVYDWPLAVYVLLVVVMVLASASYTAVRLRRTDDLMQQAGRSAQPEPATPDSPQQDSPQQDSVQQDSREPS